MFHGFRRYLLRPRVLRDVSDVDLSTTVLGRRIAFPVGLSPSGMQRLVHPEGEKAAARGDSKEEFISIDISWFRSTTHNVTFSCLEYLFAIYAIFIYF